MFNSNTITKYLESQAKRKSFKKAYRGADRSAANKSFLEAYNTMVKAGEGVRIIGNHRVTIFKRKGKKGNMCIIVSKLAQPVKLSVAKAA